MRKIKSLKNNLNIKFLQLSFKVNFKNQFVKRKYISIYKIKNYYKQ